MQCGYVDVGWLVHLVVGKGSSSNLVALIFSLNMKQWLANMDIGTYVRTWKRLGTGLRRDQCYSLEDLMLKLKLQYFGHLMQRADSLEKTLMLGKIEGQRRRGWQRMKWLDSINRQELEQTLEESEGQGSLACCSPWGHKESQLSNWTKTMAQFFVSVDQKLQGRKYVVMNKKWL